MNGTPKLIKRAKRVDVRSPAVVITADGTEVAATILDISAEGVRLECDEMLRIGELMSLRMGDGKQQPIQIRWALGTEAGAKFLAPTKRQPA